MPKCTGSGDWPRDPTCGGELRLVSGGDRERLAGYSRTWSMSVVRTPTGRGSSSDISDSNCDGLFFASQPTQRKRDSFSKNARRRHNNK